ncbi:MAG TPA: extracellular solute-binding protein, partial [Deinococcales bacterium]|nr:extracellular solute-binding protein [Deinococcales bacterium]
MSHTMKATSLLALSAALTLGVASAARHAQAPLTANQAGPTTVTFWGDWGGEGQKQFEEMAARFNASQNKYKVQYVLQQDMITKFLTSQASGTAPDIMFWDRWRTALYAPKGVLQPINAFMAKDKVHTSGFYQQAINELSWKGNVYGLPLTVDARALFYNKKLLAAAGVKPPTNWNELEQAAIKLTKRDANGKLLVAGMALDDVGLFSMYLQQAGGRMVTSDGSKTAFNSPAGLAVLNFWDKLLNKDKV